MYRAIGKKYAYMFVIVMIFKVILAFSIKLKNHPILLLFRRNYDILFCEKQAIWLKSIFENVLLVQDVFCYKYERSEYMAEQKIIDRDTYRAIKKMSREELQAFLVRYADELQKDAPAVDLREVEMDIKAVKGIGEKRAEEIMAIFERHLGV